MPMSYTSPASLSGSAVSDESRIWSAARRSAIIMMATVFVAACAHVAVPLPFTPVPFTLQPFAVLLVGMLLGPAAGFAALSIYLFEGAMGLPVFTPLGLPGVARLLGPTGGYLFAYPLAAAVAGALPSRVAAMRRFSAYAAGGAAAMTLIYICGALWYSHLTRAPFLATLSGTVLPFLLSDVVKVCAAAGIASALKLRGDRAQS